ncbi:MAG TPA: response regulator [Bacteroidota bacterium]|nr:response regulator [Bacteroidota bacterium]
MNPTLEKVAKHLRQAEEFVRAKRYSEALLEVDYIFQLDPRSYQGRTLQERIKALQKKDEEATKIPVQTTLSKEGVYRHLRIAEEYFRMNRFDEALIETERVLQSDPDNYQARSLLDRVRAGQKKLESASQIRAQSQAISLDRRIQLISQFLQEADKYIQVQQYQRALEQVAKVFTLDPTNHFAQAYSQSIEMLMKKESTPAQQPAVPPRPARVVPPAPPKVSTPAPPPQPAVVNVPPPAPHPAPKAAPPAPPAPAPPQTQAPEPSHPATPPIPELAPRPMPTKAPAELEGRLKMYREILNEMWFDGVLTPKESAELEKVRGLFNITMEQHAKLEKEIKMDAYVEALRIVLHDGVVSENEERVLDLMRKRYGITMEEHKDAESKILEAKRTPASLAKILIVDDEKTILLTYAAILRRHGYTVFTAETIHEAIALLEKETPDLILSDVMFPTPNEDGFEFYNRVRNMPRFDKVPFLLMSGISDEFVVRAGMRIGIDGYLTKPFDNELLLATISGKLRR